MGNSVPLLNTRIALKPHHNRNRTNRCTQCEELGMTKQTAAGPMVYIYDNVPYGTRVLSYN